MQEGLPRELWCRNLAHLMRVGLPICVLAKEVVEIASHLASGMVERRHPAVATRHVRKDNGLFMPRVMAYTRDNNIGKKKGSNTGRCYT
jgi:hypothetical protein